MALRNALEQFKYGKLSQASKPTSVSLDKTPSSSAISLTNLFSVDDEDDLFDFNNDFLDGGSLCSSFHSLTQPQSSSDYNNPSRSTQQALTNSSNQVASSSTHSVPSVKDSVKTTPTTHADKNKSESHTSSIQKLRSFKFVKTRSSLAGGTSLGKRASTSNAGSVSNKDDEIGPSPPKRSAHSMSPLRDDVTDMEVQTISDRQSATGNLTPSQSIQSTVYYSQQSPLTTTLSYSSTDTNHTLSQSNSTFKRPPVTRPPSSLFKTPNSSFQSSLSTQSTPLVASSTLTPTKSSTPSNQRCLPLATTGFSTPVNRQSRTVGATPDGFRTPLSRQPTALVCSPMGEGGAPAVVRTPVSTKRKFPGPAGLLPSVALGQCMDNIRIQPPSTPQPASTPRAPSLSVSRGSLTGVSVEGTEDCFSSGPWVEMLQDLDMNDSQSSALLQYNISYAIKLAQCKKLNKGKVAHLRVILKSIVPAGRNASAVLKDPTGEILGTIHSKVFDDYQRELQPGAALILRQVSLFSPAPRKHYLNITPDNIIRVYSAGSAESSQPTAQREILDLSQIERLHDSESISPSNKDPHSSGDSHTRQLSQAISRTSSITPVGNSVPSNQDFLTVITQTLPTTNTVTRNSSNELVNAFPHGTMDLTKSKDCSSKLNTVVDSLSKRLIARDTAIGVGHFAVGDKSAQNVSDSIGLSNKSKESSHQSTVERECSFFDQLCDDDLDAIIGDMGDDSFDF